MLVTIYYTDAYTDAPSAMERVVVPESGGWSRWRVYFRQNTSDSWCLAIETYQTNGESHTWVHSSDYCPLKHECTSRSEYIDWLTESVMAVYTDGAPYWINPDFANSDRSDSVSDSEHGFTGGD